MSVSMQCMHIVCQRSYFRKCVNVMCDDSSVKRKQGIEPTPTVTSAEVLPALHELLKGRRFIVHYLDPQPHVRVFRCTRLHEL
jgi:hypothetical protein